MWKLIRISILLLVFFAVSAEAYLGKVKSTSWDQTLKVVVFPIAAGHSEQVQAYIDTLTDSDFDDVEQFMARQSQMYRIEMERPVEVVLGPQVESAPPALGDNRSVPHNMWYSLKLRFWVERHDRETSLGNVRLFMVFHDPAEAIDLPHSLGFEKGLMGVVHAYADAGMRGSNNFVLAHEMLHTLGATDKYDLDTNRPLYPIGYAIPHKTTLYPQTKAEIMGGWIPINASMARMPNSLDESIIGGLTAWEINWLWLD